MINSSRRTRLLHRVTWSVSKKAIRRGNEVNGEGEGACITRRWFRYRPTWMLLDCHHHYYYKWATAMHTATAFGVHCAYYKRRLWTAREREGGSMRSANKAKPACHLRQGYFSRWLCMSVQCVCVSSDFPADAGCVHNGKGRETGWADVRRDTVIPPPSIISQRPTTNRVRIAKRMGLEKNKIKWYKKKGSERGTKK